MNDLMPRVPRFRVIKAPNNYYYAQEHRRDVLLWESQRCLTPWGAERQLRKRRRMVCP